MASNASKTLKGIVLGIIRERAQAIDADLQIETDPGQGTRITVVWTAQR